MPARHHRIAVLYRRHRADPVRPAQIVLVCLRDAPVGDLSLLDQVSHYLSHRFGLHMGVHAVLEIQVNMVGLKPPERAFHRGADALGPGIRNQGFVHRCAGSVKPDAEFGNKLHLIADILQRLSHHLLVVVRVLRCSVSLGGVEHGVTHVKGAPNRPYGFAVFCGRTVGVAKAHAAQSHGRDVQIRAQRALIHVPMPPCNCSCLQD